MSKKFWGAICVVVALALKTVGPAHAAGEFLDTSFINPNLDDTVFSMAVQSDGKILVAGDFLTAGPGNAAYNRLARFNADGSLDATFANPNLNSYAAAVAVQPDGKIVVAGNFTTAGPFNTPYSRAVRFNTDGSIDIGFANPQFNGKLDTILIKGDGKIIVGGQFTLVGSGSPQASYNNMARLNDDGTVDTTFTDPNLNGNVTTIAEQSDGKLVVGGIFGTAGTANATYAGAARFDASGTLDTSFGNPDFDGAVWAVAVQSDGKILVGGGFTNVGMTPRRYLARLNDDGTLDGAFDPQPNQSVVALKVQGDGKIYAAGGFSRVGAGSTPYTGLVRLTSAGAIDTTFPNPLTNAGGGPLALLNGGNLLMGGSFTTAGPAPSAYGRLARYFGSLYTLTITAPANGSVASSIGGINCGGACSAQLGSGVSVTLTATASSGYDFSSWGGSCSGASNPLTVNIAADATCSASFTASGGPTPAPSPTPTPTPSFVSGTTPVPVAANATTVGSGTGSISFASSFANPQNLTFTAAQGDGTALPSWLTFTPSTVSFAYDVPIPTDLPIQPLADGRATRADARATWANTIYPLLIRVAQIPVTLTATGAGESYASTIRMNFYAPRSPVAISAISLSLDGARGNGRSGRSALSWDGGQMVFETAATNIFPASANSQSDIVRYQALSGGRDRLSQTAIPGGGVANAADGASMSPAVSSDGQYAAFASNAPSVSMTPNGGARQVYRTALGYPRSPLDGAVTPAPDMVSVTPAGIAGNAASDNPVLSQDGRYVAFESAATNLGGGVAGLRRVWRKDMQTGMLEAVSTGTGLNPSISWDGRHVAFDDGTQVYLRDMTGGVRAIAQGTRPRLTARADRLAFVAGRQVMLAEVASGSLRAVTAGNGISDDPAISADGRFVAFRSAATDLVAGYAGNGLAQIFVRDVERGMTALVTQTATGGPGNGASWNPALSGDGGTVSFASDARDLVNGNPAAGQAYLAANPLPLPARTGYWYMAAIGGGQGWAMERWGNRAYVGGLAYDAQGRSQWLAGFCTLSTLTCSGTLDAAGAAGLAFSLVTAATGTNATLSVAGGPALALTPFPIGGSRTTGFAGLPQAGWWYEPGAGDNVGYFLAIDTQPQPDGSVAQVGYLTVLAYDAAGRAVWQVSQATLAADLSFSGMLTQYSGGAPFGATMPAMPASGSVVGQVRMTFDGTERARINLPNGRTAVLGRFRF